ncbi:hypothetical protein [Nannocystis punicea]|uniref:Uncharacterized protein n=1 Tax=Nannocystis punicea TaxID=2995304 RepID=A0ABY7H962_9BACT|nr:hypothetical protein [Nannocystis poenicansa]WAS95798.1 hypothetical protein O0S08_06510 [Nannocystis poenicansa]
MVVEAAAPSRWRRLGRVLRVLAMIAGGLCVLLALHPSLGYAPRGSVIAGADLRCEFMQIVGMLFLAMGATASVVVALLPSATPPALWYVVPYALGAVVAYRVFPIIMRYY